MFFDLKEVKKLFRTFHKVLQEDCECDFIFDLIQYQYKNH